MLKEWLAFPLVNSEWLMVVTSQQFLFEESNLPSLHNYYNPLAEPWLPQWRCYIKALFQKCFLACRLFPRCSPIFTKSLQEATTVVPEGTIVLTSGSFALGGIQHSYLHVRMVRMSPEHGGNMGIHYICYIYDSRFLGMSSCFTVPVFLDCVQIQLRFIQY